MVGITAIIIVFHTARHKAKASKGKNPAHRILHLHHFEKAMLEVSTSVDSRLTSKIKEFNQKFGGSQKLEKQLDVARVVDKKLSKLRAY